MVLFRELFVFFEFLLFLKPNLGISKPHRIENEVFLSTVRNNSELFKFYYPNFDNLIQLIDHLLLDHHLQTQKVDCRNSLTTLKVALQNKEEWALKCK